MEELALAKITSALHHLKTWESAQVWCWECSVLQSPIYVLQIWHNWYFKIHFIGNICFLIKIIETTQFSRLLSLSRVKGIGFRVDSHIFSPYTTLCQSSLSRAISSCNYFSVYLGPAQRLWVGLTMKIFTQSI